MKKMCFKRLACSRCSVKIFTPSFQGYLAESSLSINSGTVDSDFMCGLGGFFVCSEAAVQGTSIYWVPTVHRAINLHDPPEIKVESLIYTPVKLAGLRGRHPSISIWGAFTL